MKKNGKKSRYIIGIVIGIIFLLFSYYPFNNHWITLARKDTDWYLFYKSDQYKTGDRVLTQVDKEAYIATIDATSGQKVTNERAIIIMEEHKIVPKGKVLLKLKENGTWHYLCLPKNEILGKTIGRE